MKLSGILGYVLLTSLAVLLARECSCEANAKSANANGSMKIDSRSTREDDDDDFVPYQGERFNVFDWMLFRELGKTNTGNILLSPVSIKMALVLLYEGAQDQTAHELAGVMQLPVSRSATRDKFSTILQSLHNTSPGSTLDIGTRLYIDSNVLTRQRYAAIVKTFYETQLIVSNLSDTHTVATGINNWVRNITQGNIDKMIDDENSLKDSVMVIVNALYFKASWRRKYFSPNDIRVGKFYTKTNTSVDVPYMNTVGRFYYSISPELDAKILRIPYEGHRFAMYLILPYSLNGADHLMNEINPFILTRHVWLMQDLPVDVSIPKFKFDFTSHLEDTLRSLGIRDIFDDTATLTGIARTRRTSRRLKVSDIVQKTGIEVNENGTAAYAATEIQIGNKIEEETFHANHPFVFYIEDETTGAILYIGKVANPLETSGQTGSPPEVPTRFGGDENTVTPAPGNRKARLNN